MEDANIKKSDLIYNVIDESRGFYVGHAEPASRSRMNLTFRLASEELEKKFSVQAKENGFVGINGHRAVGGFRVSAYNAVTYEACDNLAQFMRQFALQNG
ncbi:Phosphoserine aminotransferase [compost metagenome]